MKINCAYTELVDINHLVENPKNPNKHPAKQIDLLAKIIDYQGQRSPIVVSKRSGFITKGHGRLAALKQLAFDKVAVDYQDYESEAMEYADVIADNKIAELAEHDDIMMLDSIKDLNLDIDFDMDLFGMPDLVVDVSFSPSTLEDQGELDKTAIIIMECPHCEEKFEKSQAKVIN